MTRKFSFENGTIDTVTPVRLVYVFSVSDSRTKEGPSSFITEYTQRPPKKIVKTTQIWKEWYL